jgi:hypothetical protein
MSEPRFTPGQWRTEKRHHCQECAARDVNWHWVVETAGGREIGRFMDKATARLIAAAPEMYEALEAVRELLGGQYVHGDTMPTLVQVRAALASARVER